MENASHCLQCPPIPSGAQYVGVASNPCLFECTAHFMGPTCADALGLALNAFGGLLFVPMIGVGFGVVWCAYMSRVRYQQRPSEKQKHKTLVRRRCVHARLHARRESCPALLVRPLLLHSANCVLRVCSSGEMYALADAFGTGSLLGAEFAKSARQKLLLSGDASDHVNNMTEAELPRHLHRLYMFGTNSERAPFEMPRALPPELVAVAVEDAYAEYADQCTEMCAWKEWEVK